MGAEDHTQALWAQLARLEGPLQRWQHAAHQQAAQDALPDVAHADAEVAALSVLVAESVLLTWSGEAHWEVLAAALARTAAPPLVLRLWLSMGRAAFLRGDLRRAEDALRHVAACAVPEEEVGLRVERALLHSAAARAADRLEVAARHAAEALALAGDRALLQARAWVQVASAHHLQGAHAEAEAAYQAAIARAQLARCERTLGLAMGNRGLLCRDQGEAQRARAWCQEALVLLRGVGAERLVVRLEVSMAGLDIAAGSPPPPAVLEGLLQQAWAVGDQEVALAIQAQQGESLIRCGLPDQGEVHLEIARAAAQHAGLQALAARLPRPPGRTLVQVQGDWFQAPGQARVSLRRRGPARRILAALLHTGGRVLSAYALIAAGWPDEEMSPESALQRLYTTIHLLRVLGLAEQLQTTEGGYRLVDVRAAAPGLV